jgi:hypothetical protein
VTNGQIDAIAARGFDRYSAAVFLGAKEILASNPENSAARVVVEEYASFFAGGAEPRGFEEFLLPIPRAGEK